MNYNIHHTQPGVQYPRNTNWTDFAKEAYKDFDPKQYEWERVSFEVHIEGDPSPIIFPTPGPWWCSGSGDGFSNIVVYLPVGADIKTWWPEVEEKHMRFRTPCPEGITFTDRFAKPDYWPF